MWALVDQLAYASVALLPSLWLARKLAPREYGAFSVALSIVFLGLGLHSALFVEPLLVLSTARLTRAHVLGLYRAHLAFASLVGLMFMICGAAIALHWPEIGLALAAAGPTSFALMTLSFFRRLSHVVEPGHLGLMATLSYGGLALFGLLGLEQLAELRATYALLVLGGAGFPLLLLLGRIRAPGTQDTQAVSLRDAFRVQWSHGKWLLLLSPLRFALDGLPVPIAAGLLGLEQAAVLRAACLLIAPVIQLIGSIRLALLPGLVAAIEKRRSREFVRHTLFLFLALGLANLVVLLTFGPTLLRWLYVGRYDAAEQLLPLLGLLPPLLGSALTYGSVIRARQAVHQSCLAFAVAAALGTVALILLTASEGLRGTVLGMLIGYAVLLVHKFVVARRHIAVADLLNPEAAHRMEP